MRNLVVRIRPRTFVTPWAFDSMHRELENWMDRAFRVSNGDSPEHSLTLTPRMDIAETEKGYELTADLPGMQDKDVDVSVSNDVLTITGERSYERESDGRNVHLNERGFGTFKRSFSLPDDADQDHIQARLKNGVLEIHLPKAEEVGPSSRQIKVKAS